MGMEEEKERKKDFLDRWLEMPPLDEEKEEKENERINKLKKVSNAIDAATFWSFIFFWE